jgi:ornithine cyclodeaminase/alanine dehydrogenase-like protein (mu-crystallin family)
VYDERLRKRIVGGDVAMKKQEKMNVAIVGCGAVATNHLKVLTSLNMYQNQEEKWLYRKAHATQDLEWSVFE